ncbi:unnamed protein product [Urochloa humidicola]
MQDERSPTLSSPMRSFLHHGLAGSPSELGVQFQVCLHKWRAQHTHEDEHLKPSGGVRFPVELQHQVEFGRSAHRQAKIFPGCPAAVLSPMVLLV